MVVRASIILLALLAGVLFAAAHIWHGSPASRIKPIRTGDDAAAVAFQRSVEDAYETKGIDHMERWAETLRRDESRLAGGDSKLFHFYSVLASIDCQCRDGTRMVHTFEDRKERLDAWLKRYPKSVTANLAMGILWEYRAWQVVGGFANQIPLTNTQRWEFTESMRTGWSYIQKLSISDDPYVAFFTMRIWQYGGATPVDLTNLYQESVAAWPRHYQIYFLYAKAIPASNEDLSAQMWFIHDLIAAKEDENKQVGLSYVIGSMFRGFPFEAWNVRWEDVKHAYAVRRKLYGWRNRDLNAFCHMAIQNEDWPTAKTCMAEINGHWDDVVWESNNDFVWNELIVSLH